VLKNFGMNPIPGVRVTLITRDMLTPYSGMLPGHVAGLYTKDECHLDLGRIARWGQHRLIHAEVTGLDRAKQEIHLKGRPPIPYDILSINIGSAPTIIENRAEMFGGGNTTITPVKPIDGFSARWESIVTRVTETSTVVNFVVVGGGAGGVELTLSMQSRVHKELEKVGKAKSLVTFTILNRGKAIMPQHNEQIRAIFTKLLAERSIEVLNECEATDVSATEVVCKTGKRVPFTECIWCTQASAQSWLKDTGLDLDPNGFIAVHPTLQSTNTPNVFACGDVAAVLEHPRPKAGVFAVRQGPPAAENMRRALLDLALVPFTPQILFLGIIGTGDGYGIASKGDTLALEGQWLWELKDLIDRKWMWGYKEGLPLMEEEEADIPDVARTRGAGADALAALAHVSMRCGGCGAKVGATVLSRVMAKLKAPRRDDIVVVGLDSPDDCAVIRPPPEGLLMVQTVDFFRSFIDDPFVFGRVAANHALSDVHAMCAEAQTALAIAVVPYGVEKIVEDTLYQMMAGACEVLAESNCALVGGHTCEGQELSLGFCVQGAADQDQVLRKGGFSKGDVLILTKPIGTGTLFAADMRGQAKGWWVAKALEGMQKSNRVGGFVLREHGATSCTDVTGFGLLGHLVEMCKASDAAVRLDMHKVPLLAGAQECVLNGVFSSLQPANLRLKRGISNESEALKYPAYPLLFDPQTAGGLLASVPAQHADECIAELRAKGYPDSFVIGEVTSDNIQGPLYVECASR